MKEKYKESEHLTCVVTGVTSSLSEPPPYEQPSVPLAELIFMHFCKLTTGPLLKIMNMLYTQRFHTCWAPALLSRNACRTRHLSWGPLSASPESTSEFEGVGGDKDVQEALMQQLRVQVETQTLKEEIKEDLKGKVEDLKQIGEDVRV